MENDASAGGKTFTQEQLDAIVADRLKRQKAQIDKDRISDEEIEQLRNAQRQLDAIEETSKDDLERAQSRIEALEAELAQANSKIERLDSDKRDLAIREAVVKEAAKAQFGDKQSATFVDPEDAYLALDKQAIEFDPDGVPQNVSELVAKVAETKPHLLGARQVQPVSLDGGPRETATDRPDLTPEQEHARWLAERI